MLVNHRSLSEIYTGYNMAFQDGIGTVAPTWQRIAIRAGSPGTKSKFPWLKSIPGLRQWLGDRTVHGLESSAYEIEKIEYESTIGVKVREIEADQYGIWAPYMRMMGETYAAFPDEKIWGALAAGFTTACWDSQYFFDTDHPVIDANGATQSVSNTQSGSSSPWYLLVTKRSVKPLIYDPRKEEPFKQLTPQELVDRDKKVEYGCYIDAAIGYAFWQFAFGSKAALTADNYALARAAVMGFTGDYGRPLGLIPDLLVVAPSNESAARKIVSNSLGSGGATNEWAGTAELLVSPWLS